MSGLLALLSLDGRAVTEARARPSLSMIAGRGDHAPQLWLDDGVALGHVHRATTPEAERERLPASDPSGRYWITWDGRIDNRAELTRLLALDAPAAAALTDADFVLAAFARWGEACVEHLLGDWALVIWDSEARRLFAAKDPLGWRQLYYTQSGGLLAIGSEPQQFFAGGVLSPRVNEDYLLRLLAEAMHEPSSTCYEGVRELDGGQLLTATGDGVSVHTYWSRPATRDLGFRDPHEYVDAFLELSREAMRARLRANRRVGLFLSGGLDSSYLAALAADVGAELVAITSYAPELGIDEREYARAVAGELGIEHVELDISDCWGFSRRWLTDEAFDTPGVLPIGAHLLSQAAAARELGCGVVLTGHGGDEWFDGDDRFIPQALLARKPRTAWKYARMTRGTRPAWLELVRASLDGFIPHSVQDPLKRLAGHGDDLALSAIVSGKQRRRWVSPLRRQRNVVWRRRRALELRWEMYRQGTRTTNGWRDRQVLTPHGLDIRAPLNDLRIIELMVSTPEWIKRYRGRRREVLRAAGSRLIAGDVFERPDKVFFNNLVVDGLSREQERMRSGVERIAAYPGVNAARVRESASTALRTLHTDARDPFLRLVAAGLWLRALDSGTPSSPDPGSSAAAPVTAGVLP